MTAAKRALTHERAREILLSFPGVEEGPCYGTPGFRVRGKFLARFHPDGESMVLKVDMDDREILMRSSPRIFYITDHYRAYPSVLVRIAEVERGMLRDLVEESWRRLAPKRLVGASDAERRLTKAGEKVTVAGASRALRSRGPSHTGRRGPTRERVRAR